MHKAKPSKARPLTNNQKSKKPISPSAEAYLQRYLKVLYQTGESKQ